VGRGRQRNGHNVIKLAVSSTTGGATGTSGAAERVAVAIVSVPRRQLPITQVRILRNRKLDNLCDEYGNLGYRPRSALSARLPRCVCTRSGR
jgi:hypothetical protein